MVGGLSAHRDYETNESNEISDLHRFNRVPVMATETAATVSYWL